MRIFGNDGFRSRFGDKYMTIGFLSAFANAVSNYLLKNKFDAPVLIGRDTRQSGIIIEKLITAIINYTGINTESAGIIPTPGLSSILQDGKYSLGIMITASHDPAQNNGIKLFGASGLKLDEVTEQGMENDIKQIPPFSIPQFKIIGNHHNDEKLGKKYANKTGQLFQQLDMPYKILVDCSNGAYSDIAKLALKDYKTIQFIHDKPNGNNINLNCGALEPENLLQEVRKNGFDYGVAFDGDGDRAVFVSNKYGLIETEKLIVLFSQILCDEKASNTVVSAEICNKGLEKNCEKLSLDLIQTKVGDRNVVNCVLEKNAIMGAEPSGHYFFPKLSKTMDGLLALFHFIKILKIHGNNLTDKLKALHHYNRIKKDLPAINNSNLVIKHLYEQTNSVIDTEKEKLIIRNSMWDPVLRIYYDYKSKNNFNKIDRLITETLKNHT